MHILKHIPYEWVIVCCLTPKWATFSYIYHDKKKVNFRRNDYDVFSIRDQDAFVNRRQTFRSTRTRYPDSDTSSCCRVRREATNTYFIVFLQEASERQMLPERDTRKSQINIEQKIKKHKEKTITSTQQSNAKKPRKNRKQRTHGPMKYGLKSGVPGG